MTTDINSVGGVHCPTDATSDSYSCLALVLTCFRWLTTIKLRQLSSDSGTTLCTPILLRALRKYYNINNFIVTYSVRWVRSYSHHTHMYVCISTLTRYPQLSQELLFVFTIVLTNMWLHGKTWHFQTALNVPWPTKFVAVLMIQITFTIQWYKIGDRFLSLVMRSFTCHV